MKRILVVLGIVVLVVGRFGLTHVFGSAAAAATTCTAASPDSDADHIADCWGTPNGLTVGNKIGNAGDRDRDGLTTRGEYTVDVTLANGGDIVGTFFANDDDSDNDGVE